MPPLRWSSVIAAIAVKLCIAAVSGYFGSDLYIANPSGIPLNFTAIAAIVNFDSITEFIYFNF